VLQVISGYDRQDAASIDTPAPDYTEKISAPTTSLRLGIPRAYFYEELHPEVQAVMQAARRPVAMQYGLRTERAASITA